MPIDIPSSSFCAHSRPHRKTGGGSSDKNRPLADYFLAHFFAYFQSVNTAMAGLGRTGNAYLYLQMRMSCFVHKFILYIISQFLAFLHRLAPPRRFPDNLSIFGPETSLISIPPCVTKTFSNVSPDLAAKPSKPLRSAWDE